MNELLKKEIELLPNKPGSYQMRDKNDQVIYVGKAKNLKKRVSQYFLKPQNGKTFAMVKNVDHFTTIVTNTEKESLILEMNLIKKYLPRYNIMLMDDKHYPYIAINRSVKHPYVTILRNTNNKKFSYFGPFPSSESCYDVINIINKLFPLRKCNKIPTSPCLYYHLGQCLAPCINDVKKEEYDQIIKEITLFLNGNNSKVKQDLKAKIDYYSKQLDYENAMEYSKMLESINLINEKQQMELKDKKDRDFIAFSTRENYISIVFFVYRKGKLIYKKPFVYELIGDINEFVVEVITQYYEANLLPNEIVVSNADIKKELSSLYEDKKITLPTKGNLHEILSLTIENAKESLDEHFLTARLNDNNLELLENLGEKLNISTPYHIELFDNSHLQGTNAIGAMVVYINGEKAPKLYRKFNIESYNKKDDLSSMREVLYRRYSRLKEEHLPLPDLIILDGGKTQLEVGLEVLKELDLKINMVGLFKNDSHRTNGLLDANFNEYYFDDDKALFFLLTRMQDEVHRYAITTHIKKRNKQMFNSVFDDIPHVGDKRKELLTKAFPTISELKNASLEDIEQIVPHDIALFIDEKRKSIN